MDDVKRNPSILIPGGVEHLTEDSLTADECVDFCIADTTCVGVSFDFSRQDGVTKCSLFFVEPLEDEDYSSVEGVDYYSVISRCTGKLRTFLECSVLILVSTLVIVIISIS